MSSTPVDALAFRRACSRFATGVTIVTAFAPDGTPQGLTVNSFTSISLNPPIVLVAIDHACDLLTYFLASDHFAVNVLRDSQRELSIRFSEWDTCRFDGLRWRKSMAPVLEGMLAVLECRRTATFEAGDHTILLGEVERAGFEEGKPLVYFNRAYADLAEAPAASDRAADNADS